jgi:chemotaxis family two-component system response regulator Rcp1
MNLLTNQEPAEILLIEDNLSDIRLIEEICRESGVPLRLNIIRDGEEAITYLRKQGPHASALRPALILLDLNLPKKHGLEVLAEIKGNPSSRRIPVIVLTTSNAEQDVNSSYDLHANCYITKPVHIERFMTVIQQIGSFWLQLVRFPNESN